MNLWKMFEDLLPKQPLRVATVLNASAAPRYVVELADGGTQVVTSDLTYVATDVIFVADGKIVSTAPTLTPITIDI